jgi:formylglycine-generating enzyme required for sulfatase activity/tetratricopeptide (TPR) repeat protein
LLTLDPVRLKFVLVLGRNYTDLGAVALAAFKGIPSRRISLLNRADTYRIVRLSEQDKTLNWSPKAVEMVWRLTHGHPYLTQALCSQVWEATYDEIPQNIPTVTLEMVEAAVDATLDASRNTLEWLWNGFGPAEKVISAALSGVGDQVVDDLHLEQLLRESGVRILIRELQNAPELLKNRDILEPVSGGYIFKVEILRRWIERYHSLKRTQDELDRIQPAADGLFQAAQAVYAQGDLSEAEGLLKQTIGFNPNHLRANELLAEILIGLGRLDDARDLLEHLFGLVPNNARPRLIQVCLAQAQSVSDDKKRLELYNRILELDSSRPEALAGREKIRQAEEDEHKLESDFIDGKRALQNGEWNKAIEFLQKVIANRPSYVFETDAAADLLAIAVREKEHPLKLGKVELSRTKLQYYFVRFSIILFVVCVLGLAFGMGKQFVSLGEQGYGPFKGLATSTLSPTMPIPPPTHTVTPLPTPIIPIPTNTATPIFTATPAIPPKTTHIRALDGMAMIYIPESTFQMGSNYGDYDEKPVHKVELGAFWMDKTEVTNQMFIKFLNSVESELTLKNRNRDVYYENIKIYYLLSNGGLWDRIVKNGTEYVLLRGDKFSNHPVINVTWYGASEYCEWAGGRLPTEAEWEYAARGSDERKYPWGNNLPTITIANYNAQINTTSLAEGNPAGASPFDILGMAGNVSEWVNDIYSDNYYQRQLFPNPTGPDIGSDNVIRGGSWMDIAYRIRTSARFKLNPNESRIYLGFRCVNSK